MSPHSQSEFCLRITSQHLRDDQPLHSPLLCRMEGAVLAEVTRGVISSLPLGHSPFTLDSNCYNLSPPTPVSSLFLCIHGSLPLSSSLLTWQLSIFCHWDHEFFLTDLKYSSINIMF